MNDLGVVKTLLALLVVEGVLTKKKAEHAMKIVERNFVRGVSLPVNLDLLIKTFKEDA